MVTVIADKDELIASVHNGVTAGSNDVERPSYYIKDYQEVDFHRSPSCKPFPEDLFGTDGQITKPSIQGTFFVQVDAIEPTTLVNNNNQQTYDSSSFILTMTDGITPVKGITNDDIPDLSFNVRPGCKLLLTGVIPIKDDLLQLTHDNTSFQYGSNTYPRPRSAYRGRGGGSYRPSYEGRRGGNGNTRYDNDDNESNFHKRPPPKNTLMDFMTPLQIPHDTKETNGNENQKSKDRYENKRRNTDQYYKTNNGLNATNSLSMTNSNHYYQSDNTTNQYPDQITFQQDGNSEQLDSEDDPSHSNYRERRNPLPPRLQRAQDERTRRNTNRYYDESFLLTGGEINGNYHNGTTNNPSLSTSSSYSRRGDPTSYISNNSSTAQPHPATLNYVSHANILASVNGSTPTHLAYFPANTGPLAYNLAGIPSPSFHNQQGSIVPSYTNDSLAFVYGPPYGTGTYLPPTATTNGFNNDSKANNNNQSVLQTNSFVDENETKKTNESQQDDNNNDIENKSQSSLNEQKVTSSSISSSSSSNDGNNNSQQTTAQQHEDKRRDFYPNPRPRWKIGDMCLARWSEDREFYVATIVQIQPPYCTVLFRDYNNYDQVHFGDLKVVPRDQQYYQFVQPMGASASDLNAFAANGYFPARTNYYPSTLDGCIIMPEAPPFPFNSAGTLYMCPPTVTAISRSNRYHPTNDISSIQSSQRHVENENPNPTDHANLDTTINSSSSPSKESNDTGITDSTTTSIDDNQQIQQQDISLTTQDIQLCSIADAPVCLAKEDDERERERERSTSTESITSSKYDEQQSTNENEKEENNSV